MSGLPDSNYPAFHAMEERLKSKGARYILNPANIANGDKTKPYDFYIRESLVLISKADSVVFLDGWKNSKGANLEFHCATLMNLSLYNQNLESLKEENETICQIADRLVNNDRQEYYGHPFNNFTDIGRVWGMILEREDLSPETVGLMMVGLKMAREKHRHNKDNLVDLCGYAKTISMIHEYRKNTINHNQK